MTCCAVIDTNVLVSALLSGKDDAATVQVLKKVLSGEIIPVYSSVIMKVKHFPKEPYVVMPRELLEILEE